jgi:hypothetical protein
MEIIRFLSPTGLERPKTLPSAGDRFPPQKNFFNIYILIQNP